MNTFSEFLSSNTHTFRELLPNKSKHIFRVHIKHYWHFEGFTPKQYYTLCQTSSNTDVFRELRADNTTHFSRVYIKQYWHFQRVPSKLNYSKNFFQSHFTQCWQKEFLPNNIDLFRAHIKHYSHFHRVITKQ